MIKFSYTEAEVELALHFLPLSSHVHSMIIDHDSSYLK